MNKSKTFVVEYQRWNRNEMPNSGEGIIPCFFQRKVKAHSEEEAILKVKSTLNDRHQFVYDVVGVVDVVQ